MNDAIKITSDLDIQFADYAVWQQSNEQAARIKKSLAYVDDSSAEQIAAQKGTPTSSGTESPFRNRTVDENLTLFKEMRDGIHADGARVLRAKIDMAHANMHMRDPLMYRIRHMAHHRTGNAWCIYPMYDFTHCLSDALEGRGSF